MITTRLLTALALLIAPVAGCVPAVGAAESLHVAVHEGRLTVKATDVPLDRVVAEVAARAGLVISRSSTPPEKRLTVEFHDVGIEAALARLLNGHDYVVVFAGEAAADAPSRFELSEMRVFAEGMKVTAKTNPAPRESGAPSVALLLASLGHPERATRVAAIEALGQRGSHTPLDHVMKLGLGHDDPLTRLAVLTSGLALPADVLVEHVLNDPSPAVRAEALVQVPRNDARAEAVARTALTDPDPSVQLVAREVLTMLRPPEARAAAGETKK